MRSTIELLQIWVDRLGREDMGFEACVAETFSKLHDVTPMLYVLEVLPEI